MGQLQHGTAASMKNHGQQQHGKAWTATSTVQQVHWDSSKHDAAVALCTAVLNTGIAAA